MREQLKTGYYFLQKILRKGTRLLQKIRRENLITVLNLHQVSPRENPFWSPLKPEIFDDLLGFLKENFEVVLFGEIAAAKIKNRSPFCRLTTVITIFTNTPRRF